MYTHKNFALGFSTLLNIFNNKNKKLIDSAIKNDLYFHISISYPQTFYILKILINKKSRQKIKFIAKVCGDTNDNLLKCINQTLKKFSLKKISIIQIINLPFKTLKNRNFNEINYSEFNDILEHIKSLKEKKIIGKSFIQIYQSDNLDFVENITKYFDGVTFYGDLHSVGLKENVYNFIIKKDLNCIILSVFGRPKNSYLKNLNIRSYLHTQKNFTNNTIAVGRTTKINNLKEITNYDYINSDEFKIDKTDKFESKGNEEDSSVYFKAYNSSNKIDLFKYLFVCFLKKIMPIDYILKDRKIR